MVSKDLETALSFVIHRMSSEAQRSGDPLDEEETYLLGHFPTERTHPVVHGDPEPNPVLRDFAFERLCGLAKNARLHDVRMGPEAADQWEFAAAVLQLNHHPMSWLLGWAWVKARRPRWDGPLLVGTAFVIVALFVFGAIGLSSIIEGKTETWRRILLIAGGCTYGLS